MRPIRVHMKYQPNDVVYSVLADRSSFAISPYRETKAHPLTIGIHPWLEYIAVYGISHRSYYPVSSYDQMIFEYAATTVMPIRTSSVSLASPFLHRALLSDKNVSLSAAVRSINSHRMCQIWKH